LANFHLKRLQCHPLVSFFALESIFALAAATARIPSANDSGIHWRGTGRGAIVCLGKDPPVGNHQEEA